MNVPWQRPVTGFVLFNVLGVPLIGRGAWAAMESLRADAIALAVGVSVLAAVAILGMNAVLTLRADHAGVPPGVRAVLWAITALTFVLTIGTGFFSPLTLVWALATW